MTQTNTKRIVIITTAQPSTNPRMVKEYLALKQAGYQVKVLYCFSVDWAEQADRELFETYGLDRRDFVLVGGSPHRNKAVYQFTRIKKKLADKFFGDSIHAIFRTSFELIGAASKHPADLYIAHNMGALPAAVKAAKKHQAKVAFDAEDYHRGEVTFGKLLFGKNSRIEDEYFPQLNYFTGASPLILKQYQQLFPTVPGICINNVFSKAFAPVRQPKLHDDDKIRLWWFSQKIGKGRGLEDIIRAIGISGLTNVELTLIGIIAPAMRADLEQLATESGMNLGQLHIMAPVSELELFRIGAQQDIGLALETGEPDNRKYCLTNKIFTYLLCGNAIIFSDSLSQVQFYNEHPNCGSLYERNNSAQLASLLQRYATEGSFLRDQQQAALSLGDKVYNWELESKKLVAWIEEQLGNKQQAPKL